MSSNRDNQIKPGEYVSFEIDEYGPMKGQVLDFIVSNGKRYALVEPMYLINDRKITSTLIKVEIKNLKLSNINEVENRIRRR